MQQTEADRSFSPFRDYLRTSTFRRALHASQNPNITNIYELITHLMPPLVNARIEINCNMSWPETLRHIV